MRERPCARTQHRARTRCEEQQRLLLVARNGLCAVLILQRRRRRAVALYRESLRLARGNGALFEPDK